MDTREWEAGKVSGLSNGGVKPKAPLHPVPFATALGGVAATPAGLIALIWSADWRWAASGVLVTVLMLIVAAALSGTTARERRG